MSEPHGTAKLDDSRSVSRSAPAPPPCPKTGLLRSSWAVRPAQAGLRGCLTVRNSPAVKDALLSRSAAPVQRVFSSECVAYTALTGPGDLGHVTLDQRPLCSTESRRPARVPGERISRHRTRHRSRLRSPTSRRLLRGSVTGWERRAEREAEGASGKERCCETEGGDFGRSRPGKTVEATHRRRSRPFTTRLRRPAEGG